jgi:8-oxo-dGTP diphosphatase
VTATPHRVVLAVLARTGRVLLCHRRADRDWYPDVWDFPGGHLEAGETPEDAARREVMEELGVVVEGEVRIHAAWASDDGTEEVTFVLVEDWRGEPANLAPEEHDAVRWFTLGEALTVPLAHPTMPDRLRSLPSWHAPDGPEDS